MYPSEYSAGPILSSHFYDVQSSASDLLDPPTEDGATAHAGAPVINVEVVVRDVDSQESTKRPVEGSWDGSEGAIQGSLWARGPAMGEVLGRASQNGIEG
jgi:long-chain acyl-CoA synthetase